VLYRNETQLSYGLAARIDLFDVHAIVKVNAVVRTGIATDNIEEIQQLELMPLRR
jgi:hypothetical protein